MVKLIGLLLLAIYIVWPFYLAIMNLKRVRDSRERVVQFWRFRFDLGGLTPVAYVLGWPLLLVGWALDILVDMILLTVLFWEWPKAPWTMTSRFKRHVADDGYRGKASRWFGRHLLDAFDPSGKHV